jgi:hypothetical protein
MDSAATGPLLLGLKELPNAPSFIAEKVNDGIQAAVVSKAK